MDVADPLLLTDPKPTTQGSSEDELSLQMPQKATGSSGFPTASQQGECSLVSQQHNFTSLAQLAVDNLELLELNLQQIVLCGASSLPEYGQGFELFSGIL